MPQLRLEGKKGPPGARETLVRCGEKGRRPRRAIRRRDDVKEGGISVMEFNVGH